MWAMQNEAVATLWQGAVLTDQKADNNNKRNIMHLVCVGLPPLPNHVLKILLAKCEA